MNRLLQFCVVLAFLASGRALATDAPASGAQGPTTSAASEAEQAAARVAAPFAVLAGSNANAVALATALKTGTAATLTPVPPETAAPTSLVPPTKPMGWANVSHSLELAQFALADAGIERPATADLCAALLGGVVTAPNGKTVALPGVLKQRAAGMAWSEIAHRYGTTMRTFNRTSATVRPTVAADSDRVR
jgi:hypothetical protein